VIPRFRHLLPFLLTLSLAAPACRSSRASKGAAPDPAASAPAKAPELPPLTIRDESEGLTFSYVTLDGGFQLVKKVADVPYEARDAVRVWSETSGDGIAGPFVYLADLRTKLADGTYKVEVVPRTQFDALAEARREKGKTAGKPANPRVDPPGQGEKGGQKQAKVVIYGAEWCKPCHMAEAYLEKKGVPFVHKDIESDQEADDEMRAKLEAAGLKTHSIPVIDVGGKILVGFDQTQIDTALEALGG
jgi:glutaredoxin